MRPPLDRNRSAPHYISTMKAPTIKAAKAKGPKPVYVYLKKGRHRTQPWTFTIDEPGVGPVTTKRERYARKFTAKRGALRMLKNVTQPVTFVTLN